MTYAEKLKHPNWQRKRLEILSRDKFTCLYCGDKDSMLHVHHKCYEYGREPWEYEDDNFETCCFICHKVIEFLKSQSLIPYTIGRTKILDCFIVFVSCYCPEDDNYHCALLRYFSDDSLDYVCLMSEKWLKMTLKEINKMKKPV